MDNRCYPQDGCCSGLGWLVAAVSFFAFLKCKCNSQCCCRRRHHHHHHCHRRRCCCC